MGTIRGSCTKPAKSFCRSEAPPTVAEAARRIAGSADGRRRLLVAGALVLAMGPAQGATLSLGEALDRAFEHAPQARAREAQFAADQELSYQERASRRPSVNAAGAYDYAHTESEGVFGPAVEDDYPSWSASLEVRQPLFRLDWAARGDRATALAAQAQASFDEATLALMSDVAQAYFDVLQAEDERRLAQSEAQAMAEAFEDTRKRYEVELVPGTDLREARAQRDLARARLISTQRALADARETLEVLTGAAEASLPSLPGGIEFPPLEPQAPEPWVERALQNSPGLRRQREAVTVARADLRSAKSQAAPALDAVASGSHSDTSEFAYGQTQDDARIGVELTVPIYGGGLLRSGLRRAKAQIAVAEAELARLELNLRREVRQRHREVESGYVEVDAYALALESARQAEIATKNGYEVGTRTITDMLEARSAVVQAERDLNGTRYRLLLSLLQLKQIVGVLRREDFVEIDRLLVGG